MALAAACCPRPPRHRPLAARHRDQHRPAARVDRYSAPLWTLVGVDTALVIFAGALTSRQSARRSSSTAAGSCRSSRVGASPAARPSSRSSSSAASPALRPRSRSPSSAPHHVAPARRRSRSTQARRSGRAGPAAALPQRDHRQDLREARRRAARRPGSRAGRSPICSCDRVYFAHGSGLCLTATSSFANSYEAKIFDANFHVTKI